VTSPRQHAAAERVRADRRVWRDLVDEAGPERMTEPGPMGEWTFKDLAAHLAGWRNYRISLLEAGAKGEQEPLPPWPSELDDDDAINAWLHEQDRDRSVDDALADYDGSFERMAAAIEALPEDVAEDPNAFEWMGGESVVDGDFIDHLHDEHLPAVRAWLDARS
jgi:hypothetical protein